VSPSSRLFWAVSAAWVILLGSFIAIASGMPAGVHRSAIGNVLLCLLPLFVNGALLSNATTAHWHKNAFWMLLALGITLWLTGQFMWTYVEAYQQRAVPHPFLGDIVFFLHTVPMLAALTMLPHQRPNQSKGAYGYVDLALIACWWVYLYAFLVLPWQYVVKDFVRYTQNYSLIASIENLIFVGCAVWLAVKTQGKWRSIYAQLAGAGAMYVFGRYIISAFVTRGEYSRVSLYTLPIMVSFLLFGTAGISAYRDASEEKENDEVVPQIGIENLAPSESLWAARLARIALLSLPLIGYWCMKQSRAPEAVCSFRLMITLGAVLPFGFLAFLRQELVDAERLKLLRASQDSLDNLKRLQTQFVQSEKLASLGQLVGGAAHEINNPLTAILGYSELLADDPSVDSRSRSLAEKIREQARRTKTLVNNLLSFARQVPSEQRVPLDVNTIVNSSVQFRRVDLRGKNVRIEMHNADSLPEVRGDANQLLQVFTHIINNAVDSMQEAGGGSLTVRTLFEKGNVIILFSDTGAGIRDPNLVFDPFYTTKPVGKGTGLGLSICYGLIHDQGGKISCQNRPEGGATFRVELPAAPQFLPRRAGAAPAEEKPAKLA
jgi:signal transduction histidine kinase